MTPHEIIGVVLVRNEDRFLDIALRNAAEFCDRFLLFDHGSTDRSPAILETFASASVPAEFRRITHPSESHDALRPLAGQSAWIFAVDGDEIYDPSGLARLRPRLLAGEFDSEWMVMGHVLHTVEFGAGDARGFAAPPSRSITKLYNFSAITAWPGRSMERLHGGEPVFRPGFDASKKRLLMNEMPWDKSPLRCLHMCFCRRSSVEDEGSSPRRNIDELYNRGGWLTRLRAAIFRRDSSWKQERYRRGPVTTVATRPFFDELL